MSRHPMVLESMTIDNGTSTPNSSNPYWTASEHFRDADDLLLYCPDTLPETITIEVAPTESPGAGDWKDLTDEQEDDRVAVAGKAIPIPMVGFLALRVVSSGNVVADRTFELVKSVWV